jgi:hypothetical protein
MQLNLFTLFKAKFDVDARNRVTLVVNLIANPLMMEVSIKLTQLTAIKPVAN